MKSSNPQDFEGAVDRRTQVSFEGKNMTGRDGNLLEIAKVCQNPYYTREEDIIYYKMEYSPLIDSWASTKR